MQRWRDAAISQWLELSADYLLECSEDDPDEVILLFEAATELAERNSPLLPDIFSEAIVAALKGETRPEWAEGESDIHAALLGQSRLLVTRFPGKFEALEAHVEGLGEEKTKGGDADDEEAGQVDTVPADSPEIDSPKSVDVDPAAGGDA